MATRRDPLQSFHFQVEWGGTRLGFSEVTGLQVETEVIEYREGGDKTYNARKLPGLTKFGNVTFKRGVVLDDFEFYQYWQQTLQFEGATLRRNISIKLLNDEHAPVITWRLLNAWPCKIVWGNLNATGNEVLIESMELVHEGLSIVEA